LRRPSVVVCGLVATDLAAVSKRLPPDLGVRVSADADIERVVEFQNRWATPSSWMSPVSARRAHEVSPEPNRLTLVVEDRGGARSLLEQLDDHARANAAKRLVAAVRGDEADDAAFAEAVGFRKFHERI